ncbi:MAG: proteasome assembly chaperone family protein [Candidatus Altiarchaeota archaeon]|nr:proteasome assembly chaperone family protein [Candidatus Altiarchaeota archaeon]
MVYNGTLIEGLPGIGNVGKMVVEYLIEKLKAKKIAELYSSHFPYHVFINKDSTVSLPKNEFYHLKSGNQDLVFLTGDFQSMTPQGHYEIAEAELDYIKKMNINQIITLGGFGVEGVPTKPKVMGAGTTKGVVEEFGKYGVEFEDGERVGMVVGASGVLLGLSKLKGINGICLMGETLARPMFTDARAAKAVLEVLKEKFNLEVDMEDMKKKAKELDKAISKAKDLEKIMLEKIKKPGEELRYIG